MISQKTYQKRRQKFLEQLGDGMAVLFAAPHYIRNNDTHFEFRTCSYFYYLTGLAEQEAAVIFLPKSDKPFRLFVMPKNPEMEMWEGKRFGVDGAKAEFGADEVYPIEKFDEVFSSLLSSVDTLHYPMGMFAEHDDHIHALLKKHSPNPRRGEKAFRQVKKVQEILGAMRLYKDEEEIALLRKNCANTSLAHQKAMEFTRPGLYEYQVEAEIEKHFKMGGAEDNAYASIVAGGNNATVLHYKTNRDRLKDGTLLLIDAGGEMGLYSSDITRTFPVSGKFTPAQKALYEIVLKANKECIAMVKPGLPFHDIHKKSVEILVQGLLDLGLMKGNKEEIVKDRKNYAAFYPHGTSHWLGLDVHDAGSYYTEQGESLPLAPGQVFTIEPGIYIGEDRNDVPAEYRGIGIRIEDDILVTSSGYEVLTKDCPKEVTEIEALVGKSAP